MVVGGSRYIYIWVSDESYSSPKGHHQVGASPISYQCLVILHTCVYSAIAGPSAIDLETLFFCWNGRVEQSFWCGRGGRRRGAVCVIILIVCGDLVGQYPLPVLSSSPPPIQLCLFFCNFLLNVCIIGLQLVFSIWACGRIGSLSILSASESRCLVCIQWLGICIRICTACTVVSFPIWFVDVFGWFAWQRGCEINRGRARAEHIMIANRNLDSAKKTTWDSETYYVSKMHWEWNKTFTYTRSIWCWQKKGCKYEFSWCNPKLLRPLVF